MDNDHLAQVERHNALLQVDLEWERERQGFLSRGNEPTALMFITPIVFGSTIAFLVILALAFQPEVRNVFLFYIVAVLLLIGGAIGTAYHYRKYSAFTQAKRCYSQRRAAIEQRRPGDKPSGDPSSAATA